MFIYKITNNITGKTYIGMDSGPVDEMRRWKDHRSRYIRDNEQGKKVNTKLGRSIIKHGIDAFSVEVIYHASSIQELVEQETKFIEKYDSVNSGYNMLSASQGYTLSMIEDDNIRDYLRDSRRKGSLAANHKRWSNTSQSDRIAMTEHLHNDAVNQKKSESMKTYWSERGENQERQLRGLKTQWEFLDLEQRRARTERSGGLFKAHSYIATSPDGVVYHTQNINEFCATHSLTPSGMRAVARGVWPTHKGWSCEFKDSE